MIPNAPITIQPMVVLSGNVVDHLLCMELAKPKINLQELLVIAVKELAMETGNVVKHLLVIVAFVALLEVDKHA